MGPPKQSLVENISLQRCNCNIFGLTDTMALFAKEASSLQNEVGDPTFFTFLSSLTHHLSMVKFPGKAILEKFGANVLIWLEAGSSIVVPRTSPWLFDKPKERSWGRGCERVVFVFFNNNNNNNFNYIALISEAHGALQCIISKVNQLTIHRKLITCVKKNAFTKTMSHSPKIY